MSKLYQTDSEIIKYADLCATVHNISSPPEDFYKFLSYNSVDSGFDGYAFRNDETHEVIIAISGSSDNTKDLQSVSDILSGNVPLEQLEDSYAFYQDVINKMPDGYSLSITGFSLGGALAQIIGTRYGIETYTYNALGMNSEIILNEAGITADQINLVKQNGLIKNFVVMNDPIGNTGNHIGDTCYLSPILLSYDPIDSHRNIMNTNILENSYYYYELSDWNFEKALALWKYDKLNNGEIPDNSNLLKIFNTSYTQFSDQDTATAFYEAVDILKNDTTHDNVYSFSMPDEENITGKIYLGTDNSDTLDTENSNDIIFAGAGNDILTANSGNDYLSGEMGDDSYIFNEGDGLDFIKDASSDEDIYGVNDTLKFGTGITKDDLICSKQDDNLIITFKNLPDDQITIYNQFNYGRIEFFMFSDNSLLTYYNIDNFLQETLNIKTIYDANINTDLINGIH